VYDSQTTTVTTPAGAAWIKVLNGNPRRRALSFFSPTVNSIGVNNADTGALGPAIANGGSIATPLMLYRDYGPIIQRDIWVMTPAGAASVSVTEVIQVGD
jgi:hypothetical protein